MVIVSPSMRLRSDLERSNAQASGCTASGMGDESPFFIGGMWNVWHANEEDRLYTLTVLTTFLNEVSGTVHDRMPAIVQPKDYGRWQDPERVRY
jgi:putative SOS response-associated peptidase YedK